MQGFGISLIIPTYGRENEIGDALESIAKQTDPPEELFVIDEDVDSDIENLLAEYEFPEKTDCTYVNEELGGLTSAKNYGAAMADEEIILFLDDDAYLCEETALENLRSIYRKYDPTGVFLIGSQRFSRAQMLYSRLFHLGPFNDGMRQATQYPESTGEFKPLNAMGGCGMSVRAYVFDEFQFDESDPVTFLPEDIDFSYRVGQKYLIGATATARKYHRRVKRNDLDREELEEKFYVKPYSYNYQYLVTLDSSLSYAPHYFLVNVGLLISAIYASIEHKSLAPLQGIVKAFIEILSGTTVYDKYLDC